MSYFGLFGSKSSLQKNEKQVLPWNPLTSLEQLDIILEESKKIPVVIFKYSSRCGVSRMVLRQFENNYNLNVTQVKLYFLDLIAFRDVSDEVGYKFQVMHQSPQLIVIKNGITVHHASHYSIDASILDRFI